MLTAGWESLGHSGISCLRLAISESKEKAPPFKEAAGLLPALEKGQFPPPAPEKYWERHHTGLPMASQTDSTSCFDIRCLPGSPASCCAPMTS